jgi:hypothetical protein
LVREIGRGLKKFGFPDSAQGKGAKNYSFCINTCPPNFPLIKPQIVQKYFAACPLLGAMLSGNSFNVNNFYL